MRLLKLGMLLLGLLCAVSLSAQTADEIIAKNIQAHGGLAKLKAIQSIRITGNFETSGFQAGFIQVYKRPLHIRLDAKVGQITVTQAYDGQKGWQIMPFTGNTNAEVMNADDLKRLQEQADFDGPLVDYKQKGNAVQLVGKEKVDGADTYHIQVTQKNGDVRHFYLDATTYLVTKTTGKTIVQGATTDIETKSTDYRSVEGVMFPFSLAQVSLDGQIPDQKVTFQKVELNVPVEDSFFKMPAAPPADKPTTTGPGGQPK